MAEKQTNLSQMRKLALRTKAEFISLLVDTLSDTQVSIHVTLPAANWANGAQTIQNENLLADSNYQYFVCLDAESLTAGRNAGIRADNITSNGQIAFHCDSVPSVDLAVNILRLEVEA